MKKFINFLSNIYYNLKRVFTLKTDFEMAIEDLKRLEAKGLTSLVLEAEISEAKKTMQVLRVRKSKTGRYLIFHVLNTNLVPLIPSLFGLHHTLFNHPVFKTFGDKKIIIGTVSNSLTSEPWDEISFHQNILVDNNTTDIQYINKIIHRLVTLYDEQYLQEVVKMFTIKVWNMDEYANKSLKLNPKNVLSDKGFQAPVKQNRVKKVQQTVKRSYSTSSNSTTPPINQSEVKTQGLMRKLKPQKSLQPFATADIETVNVGGFQIPVAITCCYKGIVHYFQVNPQTFFSDQETSVKDMFNDYFNFTFAQEIRIIFYHNLGSFDGRFLLKYLSKYRSNGYELISPKIDESHKFICLKYSYEPDDLEDYENYRDYTFLDSLRIFPVSLEKLCKIYGVSGKLSAYNVEFNNVNVLNNEDLLRKLKVYSMQDSKCLYDALIQAQGIYFKKYNVDITTVVSTASLSKKIFRTHFLAESLPLLKKSEDCFVRGAYYGGATDIYKEYGEDLYYYDVNSLYPHVMLKKLPTKVVRRHKDGSTIKINNFFGFIDCTVISPDDIKHPIIPFKHGGRTIYPRGSWKGVYFSEMIKEAMKYGYKFKFHRGYEFEGEYIFKDYIEHFYAIKAEAKSNGDQALTFIAKMHLNQLYGIFGRKSEQLNVIGVKNSDYHYYLISKLVKNIIEINDDVSLLILEEKIQEDVLEGLKSNLTSVDEKFEDVNLQSNVAIAAAVTSYAQILMMQLKNNPDYILYYTDTDSFFLNKQLPDYMIGNKLGQYKNETLDKYGCETIDKAYFLGIKKYGYVVNHNGKTFENSVFAGVKRDSLSFKEIEKLASGETIVKDLPTRWVKSINDLSIKDQNIKVTLKKGCSKTLINNNYIPLTVNVTSDHSLNNTLIKKLNKVKNILTKGIRILTFKNPLPRLKGYDIGILW
jgi:hypothetical protein